MSRYIDYEVEIDILDFIDKYYDDDLVEEMESRGFALLNEGDKDSRRTPDQNLHEQLCNQFSLSRHTSKMDLLSHIHSLL